MIKDRGIFMQQNPDRLSVFFLSQHLFALPIFHFTQQEQFSSLDLPECKLFYPVPLMQETTYSNIKF